MDRFENLSDLIVQNIATYLDDEVLQHYADHGSERTQNIMNHEIMQRLRSRGRRTRETHYQDKPQQQQPPQQPPTVGGKLIKGSIESKEHMQKLRSLKSSKKSI